MSVFPHVIHYVRSYLLYECGKGNENRTRYFDMVLCVEVVDVAFGTAFGTFLDAGGYQARERTNGTKEFYRFHRPTKSLDPNAFDVPFSRDAAVDLLRSAYGLR